MKNKFALMNVDTETVFYAGALMEHPMSNDKCVLTNVVENGFDCYMESDNDEGFKYFQYISECPGWEIVKVAPY